MYLHPERLLLAASITLFVELFLFPSTVFSTINCTSSPLALPIKNVTLSTGNARRGIPVSIGTPAQSFSLKLSASVNNTIFKQGPLTSTNCDTSSSSGSRDKCIMAKGGIYVRDSSSSWSGPMTKQEFLHEGATDNYKSIDVVGEETVHISGLNVTNVPIGIEDGSDISTSSFGLGTNSSLINSLLDNGDIPSRMWGLDWGWTGATAATQAQGSLVLGGYDKSKVKGDTLYTQDFPVNLGDSDGCALIVYITGISMKNDTNELQLLESKGDSIRACVAPEYELITMPYSLFTIFNDAMGGVYVNRTVGAFYLWGFESDAKTGYTGTMTIKFSNGLSITIPNHELIQPYRDFDTDGKTIITNSKKNVLMLNSLQEVNENDLPLLGLPFLSAAYLVVDPDQNRFLLGESQRSTTPDLVSGALSECPENSASSPSGTQVPQDVTPTNSATTSPTSSPGGSSSSAAAIGGGVGGVAALAVISALAFIFWKRSKKRKAQGLEDNTPVESMHMVQEQHPEELDGNSMHMIGVAGGGQQKGHSGSYELPGHTQGYAPQSPNIYEADSTPVPHYTDSTDSAGSRL